MESHEELWRVQAYKLQKLLDYQNKGYYEAARDRDRLLFENAKLKLYNRFLSIVIIAIITLLVFAYLCK